MVALWGTLSDKISTRPVPSSLPQEKACLFIIGHSNRLSPRRRLPFRIRPPLKSLSRLNFPASLLLPRGLSMCSHGHRHPSTNDS